MTLRLAALLLGLAARRWPEELRADLRREWAGELHALAAQGRRGRALGFAASLALTRPRVRPFSVTSAARSAWSGVRLMLVLPVAALAVGALASCAAPFTLAGAVLMAVLGGTWTARRVPMVVLIPAMTVPGCALYAVLYALGTGTSVTTGRHTPATLVFAAGLTLTLAVVAPLAGRVRQLWAWLAGFLGAFAAADAAVAMPWLGDPELDAAGSPMWMVAALTHTGFGLPHPDRREIFIIQDQTVIMLDASVYLVLAGLALGAVIAARVHANGRRTGGAPAVRG